MHPVAILDIMFFLSVLAGLIILLKGWKRAFSTNTKLLLTGLIFCNIVYSFCLSVQWLSITEALERVEDFVGVLVPLLWAFIIYAMVQDITSSDLAESEEKYRSLIEDQTEFIVRWLPDGTRTFCNDAYCRYYGLTYEQAIGSSFFPLISAEYRKTVQELIGKLTPENPVATEEHSVILPDGSLGWNLWTSRAVFDKQGKIIEYLSVGRDITDRKEAEEALKESEERYRLLFASSNDGLLFLDSDQFRFLDCNEKACEMLGCSREQIIGETPIRFSPEFQPDGRKSRDKAIEINNKVLQGQAQLLEWRHIKYDGTLIDIEVSLNRLELSSGVYVQTIWRDITARKKAEAELKRLIAILENTTDLVSIATPDKQIAYINTAGRRLLGWSDDETVTDKSVFDVHSLWALKLLETEGVPKAIRDGVWSGETALLNRDGTEIPVSQVIMSHKSPDGQLQYLSTIIRDITERKQAEAKLREKEQQQRQILDTMTDSLVIIGENAQYLYVNDAYCRMYQYSREEFLKMRVPDILHPDYYPVFERYEQEIREKGYFWGETVEFRKDGTTMNVEVHGSRIHFGGRECLLAILRDITDRKNAEQVLRDSETKLHAILDHHFQLTGMLDRQGRLLAANRTALEFAGGIDESEVLGQYFWDGPWWEPSQKTVVRNWIERAAGGEFIRLETTHITVDGQVRNVDFSLSPVKDEDGRVVYIVPEGRDITVLKQAEQQRERLLRILASKNEELESILYVSTHDLKSPLVNITGFCGQLDALCRQFNKHIEDQPLSVEAKENITAITTDAIPESLGFITDGALKMNRLLDGMLEVSQVGRAELNIEKLEMNPLIEKIRQSVGFQVKTKKVSFTIEDLPECLGDPVQINQVFTNLLDNALKYLDPDRQSQINVSGWVEEGRSIYRVKDNGIGIKPNYQKKIFELFHRLNPQDGIGGKGIGLTIVKRILDQQRGKIWVESEPGKGSCFFVSLPNSSEPNILSPPNFGTIITL